MFKLSECISRIVLTSNAPEGFLKWLEAEQINASVKVEK